MSKSREQLNKWLKGIELEGGCLLDVGVQDKPVENRLGRCEVDCYRTLDVDDQWLPDYVADLNLDWTQDIVGDKKFDYVFMIEVIEHLWNPIFALEGIRDIMNPGGLLYISWPFINPMHDFFDANRYTMECMEAMLDYAGFSVVDIEYRRATVGADLLNKFFKAEGMRVSKIRPKFDKENKDIIGYMLVAEYK
jgi:SAM-dependent methyltransferase